MYVLMYVYRVLNMKMVDLKNLFKIYHFQIEHTVLPTVLEIDSFYIMYYIHVEKENKISYVRNPITYTYMLCTLII